MLFLCFCYIKRSIVFNLFCRQLAYICLCSICKLCLKLYSYIMSTQLCNCIAFSGNSSGIFIYRYLIIYYHCKVLIFDSYFCCIYQLTLINCCICSA